MTDIRFERLVDLPVRQAWKHEALEFTPWLAENIDHLSEAIGVPLELTGIEVAVESFSADIPARNPMDGSVVLIENQLEQTDHTHLGQVMTYLAGLDAQSVIWIAPSFREPHLSAIRWLNQHTADGFSFFAVKVRVVRIGDSPFAPIFEVIEKPNDWERAISQRASSEGAAHYDVKQRFWTECITRHPELAELGFRAWRYPNNYVRLHDVPRIELSVFIGKHQSGAFVRSAHSAPFEPVLDLLQPHAAALEARLAVPFGPLGKRDHCLMRMIGKGQEETEAWPQIMDGMPAAVRDYLAAFDDILAGTAGRP